MSRLAAIAGRARSPHPDPEVRKARVEGHEVFDMLWQDGGWSRGAAYRWLEEQLGYEFHFASADVEQCERAKAICEEKLEGMGVL